MLYVIPAILLSATAVGIIGLAAGAAYRAGLAQAARLAPQAIPVPVIRPVAVLYHGPNRRPCKLYR